MIETELQLLEEKQAIGQLTNTDIYNLVAEVRRLREWLEYAEENMTYPGVQMLLQAALTDQTVTRSEYAF
jgi:hypothetical protein